MKRVCIFTGGGFFDEHIISFFCNQGLSVNVISQSYIKPKRILGAWPLQITYKIIDFSDETSMRNNISGSNIVINLSTMYTRAKKASNYNANIKSISDFCLDNGILFAQILPTFQKTDYGTVVYYDLCTSDPIFRFFTRCKLIPICYNKNITFKPLMVTDITNALENILHNSTLYGRKMLIAGPTSLNTKAILKKTGQKLTIKLPKFLARFLYNILQLLPRYFIPISLAPDYINIFTNTERNYTHTIESGSASQIAKHILHITEIYKKSEID